MTVQIDECNHPAFPAIPFLGRVKRPYMYSSPFPSPFWLTAGDELAQRPIVAALPAHEHAMTVPTHGGRWTEARWLRLGDVFLTKTGRSATVSGLTIRIERTKVYNLHVDRLHHYAVGEAGVLVHNSGLLGKPDMPKGFPWKPGEPGFPAVLKDGKVYIDRFHITATQRAGGHPVQSGHAVLDQHGNVTKFVCD